MDDSTCCGTCLMKSDLQNSTDKFAFLKDNWPSFGQIESIDKLSKQELNCTLCFLNVLIDEFVNEKSACPNRVITRFSDSTVHTESPFTIQVMKPLMWKTISSFLPFFLHSLDHSG